jgi:hypothetical protein
VGHDIGEQADSQVSRLGDDDIPTPDGEERLGAPSSRKNVDDLLPVGVSSS